MKLQKMSFSVNINVTEKSTQPTPTGDTKAIPGHFNLMFQICLLGAINFCDAFINALLFHSKRLSRYLHPP